MFQYFNFHYLCTQNQQETEMEYIFETTMEVRD